jgi:hypothetical protein
LRGSEVATVISPPSTLTGHTAYVRKYLAERFFKTGRADGISSRERYGRSC